jgi:hypothetical protein
MKVKEARVMANDMHEAKKREKKRIKIKIKRWLIRGRT